MPTCTESSGAIPPTILVVDDEVANRKLLAAILSSAYTVLEAPNGLDALELLERAAVDLVLLDVMMPKLDGLETCRRIKARADRGYLPVILLTALSDQEDRNKGLEAGADDFVTKPFDSFELFLRVRTFLRLRANEARIRDQEALLRKQLEEMKQLQTLKEDLFSLIVHDIRNPLSGVVGFVELLQVGLTDPRHARLKGFAEQAREAAAKVQDTLSEILQIQLLEGGELALKVKTVSARTIARDAIASLEGFARAQGRTAELVSGDDVHVPADEALVRRSVENLIGNALKYSPRGEVVSVSVRPEPDGVAVEVADRGPGVPDALKGHLFQKFASVEARTGKERRGHGLGLYLVKLVATAHRGAISVHDRPGGGAVFRLFLSDRTGARVSARKDEAQTVEQLRSGPARS